ncbi:MAG: 3-hydroxyacyl-CoA dehydrogenase [Castellaniella sp.]|uniref:3-hydroxyacyl-CoA dehydrogenase NAD-binding domain-containing protein n=1 Tax=Castellaniella sp. TaxID=1955812 RepID=UPI00120AD766|nr:3-hydroxyacyl-CoA dehydrogenase NAD-binding domain-containing protein [Castellaniella sp.]TAN27579.1 MAG: 3-hydroxyacyl-CoA dehydrogenase [Castellaniella sp.]
MPQAHVPASSTAATQAASGPDAVAAAVRHVTVIGAGTIGASWTALFLAHGLRVTVSDPLPDAEPALRALISQAWPTLVALGVAPLQVPWLSLDLQPDPAAAVAVADFVQENAPERESLKIDLFARMDEAARPDVILASSSSGLIMSRLQSRCRRPDRCVIGHPFNPPHLIPLVEVVGGQQTSPDTIARAMAFYRRVGKHPIRINKEVVGHVANRLQAAVWREAIHLALENVASVEDIDAAMSQGPGLRWAVFGPHMTFHLGGGQGGMGHFLDHLKGPVQSWWDDLGDARLDETTRAALLAGLEQESAGRSIDDLAAERDAAIIRILAVRQTR